MSEVVGACVSLKSSLVISGYKGESHWSFGDSTTMGAANAGLIIIIGNTQSLLIGKDSVNDFTCMTSGSCMRIFFSFFKLQILFHTMFSGQISPPPTHPRSDPPIPWFFFFFLSLSRKQTCKINKSKKERSTHPRLYRWAPYGVTIISMLKMMNRVWRN